VESSQVEPSRHSAGTSFPLHKFIDESSPLRTRLKHGKRAMERSLSWDEFAVCEPLYLDPLSFRDEELHLAGVLKNIRLLLAQVIDEKQKNLLKYSKKIEGTKRNSLFFVNF